MALVGLARRLALATLALIGLGCSSTVDSSAASASLPTFGQPCGAKLECAAGLECQQSDYASVPWCTAPCSVDKVKNYCDSAALQGVPALCVQMPADFAGPKTPFCAPVCSNLAACTALGSQWELCNKLEYKKKVLITDLPTKVCMAPSANGQVKVDPVVCDWEAKVTDPLLSEAKQQCKLVCKSFLMPCQYWPKTQSEACCGWACMQYLTPGGALDNDRLSGEIKCLTNAFAAYKDGPKICTGWQEQGCPMPAVLNPSGK